MLGERSRPAIGKLPGVLRSGGIVDSETSPRSPLEYNIQSPRGLKNYDQGGVGLAIVVALDNKAMSHGGGEILAKYAIFGQISSRSNPIPINKSTNNKTNDMEGLGEDFTCVTCHGPNKSITTRVYYDGVEYGKTTKEINKIAQNVSVFKISPARLAANDGCTSDSDFLSSCHLCRKALHGKDIYMYRGEKAFCSAECRQRHIGMDERKEKCRSEASRSTDVSSLSHTYTTDRGQIFSTGIIAV